MDHRCWNFKRKKKKSSRAVTWGCFLKEKKRWKMHWKACKVHTQKLPIVLRLGLVSFSLATATQTWHDTLPQRVCVCVLTRQTAAGYRGCSIRFQWIHWFFFLHTATSWYNGNDASLRCNHALLFFFLILSLLRAWQCKREAQWTKTWRIRSNFVIKVLNLGCVNNLLI